LDMDDWREIVKTAQGGLDDDTAKETARDLMRRLADLMPTDFLLVRAARGPGMAELERQVGTVDAIRRRTGGYIKASRLEDLSASEDEAFRDLQRLAGFYPGLELDKVLDGDETPGKKAAEISRRIALIERTYRQNPTVEFLALDYRPD